MSLPHDLYISVAFILGLAGKKSRLAIFLPWLYGFHITNFGSKENNCFDCFGREIMSGTIQWEDFEKVDMRAGRVVKVEPSLARKPTYRFTLDFGLEIGIKVSCAALTNYSAEELLGEMVIAVVNFPPKKMGPERSEVLILGLPGKEGGVIRLRPERDVELGARVY